MSAESTGETDRWTELRSRLSQEWTLWLEFAPEAVASVGYLAVLGLLTLVLGSLELALAGTGIWLAGAAVWVLLGRTR
ncbi:hypothetical protein ACYJ1Y_00510 [Natrialbaceae archaeon A-gly3]